MLVRNSHPLHRLSAATVLAALLLAPVQAWAGPATLKRAVGNIVQSPIDLVLSPITAGVVEYKNLTNIEDTMAVRIGYALPGYFWLWGLTMGATVLRLLSGVLEFLPGLVLLFTDAEMDPLFDPVEKGEAVIWDYPSTVMDFKLGVDYTAAPF